MRRTVLIGLAAAGAATAVCRHRKRFAPATALLLEGERVCLRQLAAIKTLPYEELLSTVGDTLQREVRGEDGVLYSHDTLVFLDDEPRGVIRVAVEVWAYDDEAQTWTYKLARGGLLVPPPPRLVDQWLDPRSHWLARRRRFDLAATA